MTWTYTVWPRWSNTNSQYWKTAFSSPNTENCNSHQKTEKRNILSVKLENQKPHFPLRNGLGLNFRTIQRLRVGFSADYVKNLWHGYLLFCLQPYLSCKILTLENFHHPWSVLSLCKIEQSILFPYIYIYLSHSITWLLWLKIFLFLVYQLEESFNPTGPTFSQMSVSLCMPLTVVLLKDLMSPRMPC